MIQESVPCDTKMFEFEVGTLPAVTFSRTPAWQTISAIQFNFMLIIFAIDININWPPQRVSKVNLRFFRETVDIQNADLKDNFCPLV